MKTWDVCGMYEGRRVGILGNGPSLREVGEGDVRNLVDAVIGVNRVNFRSRWGRLDWWLTGDPEFFPPELANPETIRERARRLAGYGFDSEGRSRLDWSLSREGDRKADHHALYAPYCVSVPQELGLDPHHLGGAPAQAAAIRLSERYPRDLWFVKAGTRLTPEVCEREWTTSGSGRTGHGLILRRTSITPCVHLALLAGASEIHLWGVDLEVRAGGPERFCDDRSVDAGRATGRTKLLREQRDVLYGLGVVMRQRGVRGVCHSPVCRLDGHWESAWP